MAEQKRNKQHVAWSERKVDQIKRKQSRILRRNRKQQDEQD